LKAKEKLKRAPKGSQDLEAFLSAVEKEIIDHLQSEPEIGRNKSGEQEL
jgi:hypothetical protein